MIPIQAGMALAMAAMHNFGINRSRQLDYNAPRGCGSAKESTLAELDDVYFREALESAARRTAVRAESKRERKARKRLQDAAARVAGVERAHRLNRAIQACEDAKWARLGPAISTPDGMKPAQKRGPARLTDFAGNLQFWPAKKTDDKCGCGHEH